MMEKHVKACAERTQVNGINPIETESTHRRDGINYGWAVISQAEEKNCPEGC